jgi:hypothetical protein
MVRHLRKDELDRFYTMPAVVESCLAGLDLTGFQAVEPSAGAGAFSDRLPGCLALDIAPAGPGIIEADFLTWKHPPGPRYAVIGNPPYGVNGALVRQFIHRACGFAELVGFVLPISYAKPSMHTRWPICWHLEHELILPTPNAILDGIPINTRNVWQVWRHHRHPRPRPVRPVAVGWRKVAPAEATHAMRTHGVGRGRLSPPATANRSSHVFVAVDGALDEQVLVGWPWPDLNMGQPSAGWDDYCPALNAAHCARPPAVL